MGQFPGLEGSRRKVNILVVDDDRGAVELIQMMLKVRGYGVVVAYSGSEALELLEDALERTSLWEPLPIDLVLLDIMMPGLDGFKVCQQIKQDQRLRHIPVIMVTALENTSDRVAAVEFGADGYITKPFLPEELGATIKAELQVKRREEELLRRNLELEAINKIAAAASTTLDPKRVLSMSFTALLECTNASAAVVYRHDESKGELTRVLQRGVQRPDVLPIADSISGRVFRTCVPVLRLHISQDPEMAIESTDDVQVEAYIGVPIQVGGQSLGVLEVYSTRPYGFVERDLKMYQEIGERIGVALQNAEIFRRIQTLLLKSSALAKGDLEKLSLTQGEVVA